MKKSEWEKVGRLKDRGKDKEKSQGKAKDRDRDIWE